MKKIKHNIGKVIIISFEDGEEEALERVLSVLEDEVQFEPIQTTICSILQYSGHEIRLTQRKVLRDGEKVALTRHEYDILTDLTTYLGGVFSKKHIFEDVWQMDSSSCFTAVSSTISRLRAKIEDDRKNLVYIKTVQDGYMFDMQRSG